MSICHYYFTTYIIQCHVFHAIQNVRVFSTIIHHILLELRSCIRFVYNIYVYIPQICHPWNHLVPRTPSCEWSTLAARFTIAVWCDLRLAAFGRTQILSETNGAEKKRYAEASIWMVMHQDWSDSNWKLQVAAQFFGLSLPLGANARCCTLKAWALRFLKAC